jgi:hypothetical protein
VGDFHKILRQMASPFFIALGMDGAQSLPTPKDVFHASKFCVEDTGVVS